MRFIFPLLLVLTLAACGGKGDNGQTAAPSQRAQNVIISESEMGEGAWLLQAQEAEFFSELNSYVIMQNPYLILKENGRETSSIRASEGVYNIEEGIITLTGDVTGISATESAKIETQKVFYDINTKLVWSSTAVKVTRGGVQVRGQGFKANSDFSEIEIFKQKTTLPKNIEDLQNPPPLKV